MTTWTSYPPGPMPTRRRRRSRAGRALTAVAVLVLASTTSTLVSPVAGATPVTAKPKPPTPKPATPKVRPVTGPRVHLAATASGLTATLRASSTAAQGDAWWACFGDRPCRASQPSAHGTVGAGGSIAPLTHTYARAGSYPASLTVIDAARSITAARVVTVRSSALTAVLTANSSRGTGALPVLFDASKSIVTSGSTWAFCFGDRAHCSQNHPDASGTVTAATPTIALPSTAAHAYTAGKFTARLWVTSGSVTSSAAILVGVSPPVPAPDATCAAVGTLRTCDLFAKATGSVTVGSATIPFWGFTLADTDKPRLGGPTLIATAGEQLAFTVHNELSPLAGNVAITVPALAGAPDLTGIAPGSSGASSTFSLTRPGTYVYEAGLTPGGERQVAMGLSGVLIVRPSVATASDAMHCAYDAAVSATDCVANHDALNYYDQQKLVVVNELDAGYNADPFHSDTAEYHPTNYFIDGVAYDPSKPALDPSAPGFDPALDNVRLDAAPGNVVLMRYADLGLREHSLNLDNLLQSETARDGYLLPYAGTQNTEFLNAGETADAFLTIPAGAVTGTRYPLYDAGFHLNNGATGGIGGMYTYLDVINGATAADVGPVGTAATAEPTFDPTAPNVDNGQVPSLAVHASFTAQPAASGTTPAVQSVQWALDGVPTASGGWQASTAAPVPAGATTAAFDFTISASVLRALFGTEPDRIFGEHTVWLQATDANGKAGPAIGASFTLAMRDPVISTLSINPEVTNGTTGANQFQTAATTIAAASNGLSVPQPTLAVGSTAGFPASCQAPTECQITIGTTIASGPAIGSVVYQAFTYAGTTPTSLTGLAPAGSIPPGVGYTFSTGNTVLLDSVPGGYVAVNATATASLPGWVIDAAQACITPANPQTAAAPDQSSGVEAACASPANVYDLTTNGTGALVAVNGVVPPQSPTVDPEKYWIVVRAEEGPDGQSCTVPGTCRWSPWLYYPLNSTADPATYRTLTMVTNGPTTSGLSVTPNPNNGFDAAAGNLGLVDSFDITATATSPAATIALAEAFVATTSRASGVPIADPAPCTTDPNTPAGCVVFGQGAEMTPADGQWGQSLTKTATAFAPLSALQGLPDGLVRIWVHAQDVAGNWGPFASVDLVLDHTAPVVDQVQRVAGAAQVTAHDAYSPLANPPNPSGTNGVSSGLAAAEYFTGADPGPGKATPVATAVTTPANSSAQTTFTISGLPHGTTVNVRVRDAAGNWSAALAVTL